MGIDRMTHRETRVQYTGHRGRSRMSMNVFGWWAV
jgi:hypothetical protein